MSLSRLIAGLYDDMCDKPQAHCFPWQLKICMYSQVTTFMSEPVAASLLVNLLPRLFITGGGEEPGTHCLSVRSI